MRKKAIMEIGWLICIVFACMAAARGDLSFVVIFCTLALSRVIRENGEKNE